MEKKERTQLAVIGVGLVIFAYFLVTNLSQVRKKPVRPVAPAGDPGASPQPAAGAPVRQSSGKLAALQEKRWELPWARDPFWALSENTGKLVELQLRGISFSRSKKGFAFINDQIVTVGDTVNGYYITKIEKDKVLLLRGTQAFILSFSDTQ